MSDFAKAAAQFAGAALFLWGMFKLGYELGKSHGLRMAARREALRRTIAGLQ